MNGMDAPMMKNGKKIYKTEILSRKYSNRDFCLAVNGIGFTLSPNKGQTKIEYRWSLNSIATMAVFGKGCMGF